ncbi:alpha/beta hydrolase [Spongiimicrobium salis]|uniref:alpha/beta hydrolase n=1 Tax=Spongiimicrobium salis TaxID=1667022 RepID=UPI00374CE091
MKKYLTLLLFCWSCLAAYGQQQSFVLPLWKDGAPGFEHKKDLPEKAKDWWVKSIHNPSITVFPAKHPNGAAVLICPGGGHRELVFDEEGTKAAQFLNAQGVTAIVLKYRLFREEGSVYTPMHPKEDVTRAMRLIRSKATSWNIDSDRIGLMGFSAGGEVVNMVAFEKLPGNSTVTDLVEREAAHPNFHIQIYPGPLGIPEKVSSNAIPVFLLASNKDACCSESIFKLLKAYRDAGAEVEAHFYAKGDHGFNMGDRSKFKTISGWPERLSDWLADNQYFKK